MTDRKTASTITDAEVDELYDVLERVRHAVFIADDEDVTDWQRGFRSCAGRVLFELDQTTEA